MKQTALLVVTTLLFFGISGCSNSAPPKPTQSMLRLPSSGDATNNSLKIGDVFPSIESIDLNGATHKLDKTMLGEKYTLVVFWSTWCGFCMQELPHEIELYEKYEGNGLAVVGINADETIESGRAAAIENSIPWPNLYEGNERRISQQLGVTSWPAMFLLDSNGKIIATDKFLRRVTVRTYPNGEQHAIGKLDWTLEELLEDEANAE